MADYLLELASKLSAEYSARMAETMRFNTEHEIKVKLAPHQWEELKRELRNSAENIAKVSPVIIRCEDDGPHKATLVRIEHDQSQELITRAIPLTFYPEVPVIIYTDVRGRDGRLNFVVVNDDLQWVFNGKHQPFFPEIVHYFIEMVSHRSF